MKPLVWLRWVVAASLVMVAASSAAAPGTRDPAARGVDLFVHAPGRGSPGASLPLQAQALGFSTVVSLRPLSGATLEAAWDPESLGPGVSVAPPPVRAVADESGRLRLEVPVPPGDAGTLRLLLGLRSGDHSRVRTIEVERGPAQSVQLYVADRNVVPGSTITAWVLVRESATRQPTAATPVELRLLEGGVARSSVRLTTDAAGSATGRVKIPRTGEPSWRWTLQARVPGTAQTVAAETSLQLQPREETPGTPALSADFKEASVLAGHQAAVLIRVRDAADKPVARLAVRYWIGPRGTNPPEEPKAWKRASTAATTDARGEVSFTVDAPSTVAPGVGTTLRLVAKTVVDGHELNGEDTISVGMPEPKVELLPEGHRVIGGVEQRLLLRVRDGLDRPVTATFALAGDGLDTTVSTDAHGEAELRWRAPREIGAYRGIGPCAGGVAAAVTVRPTAEVAAFGKRREPFQLCVPTDRDSGLMLQAESPVVRAGEPLRLRVLGGADQPWSVALRSKDRLMSASTWLADGRAAGSVQIPEGASGLWSVSAVSPEDDDKSRGAKANVLVLPKVLPKLTAKIVGGRAAPGGTVQVAAQLSDGQGRGLTGTVAIAVFDARGGGSDRGLRSLDTRTFLCRQVGIDEKRCDALLEGAASGEAVRRGLLGAIDADLLEPAFDPKAEADEALRQAFAAVLRSLEGAVNESTQSPERLRDARRKARGKWTFNPELWTLVTAAMSEPPTTPGGEPLALGDLAALDRQVTFDNVARRVTRLKLLRVLMAVDRFARENWLLPGEPALNDPAALLRRLVRGSELSESDLLDPWGGTLQFVRAGADRLPFLVVNGFALHSPGPDGRLGNADDVKGPFERVLRSKTPYAEAMGEDRVVDAKLDMRVAESTVDAWRALLEQFTGTSLGTVGHGAGTGTGQGFGAGHGRLGSSHRARPPRLSLGIMTGDAFWLPPARTDAQGRLQVAVPLGDVETTWRIALVGVPDQAQTAVTTVDVPVALPLSARLDAGAAWVAGDAVDVAVTLRNRSSKSVVSKLSIAASGAARLARSKDAKAAVRLPAKGTAVHTVRVVAPRAGRAAMKVTVTASGQQGDVVDHRWQVHPKGEPTVVSKMVWVEGEREFAIRRDPKRLRARRPGRVIVERGERPFLAAALRSLDPDRLGSPEAMADALDAASRVQRWALSRGGQDDPLVEHGRDVARRATGRLVTYFKSDLDKPQQELLVGRSKRFVPTKLAESFPKGPGCPPAGRLTTDVGLRWLAAEPAPVGGAVLACWDGLVTAVTEDVARSTDPVVLARAVLALADRPHRRTMATSLAARLRERVQLRSTGQIRLEGGPDTDRASRAIVYAALLRVTALGSRSSVSPAKLAGWLAVQRDPYGGYGSTLATRSAVAALLESPLGAGGTTQVSVDIDGRRHQLQLGPDQRKSILLSKKASRVRLNVKGSGVLLRLVRNDLRLWSQPPAQAASPVDLRIRWPKDAKAGRTSRLQVSLRHELDHPTTIDVRIPLPPGVSLAAPVSGVRQVQGVVAIRREADGSALPAVFHIPVRFALSGKVSVPEAHARLAFEEAGRTVAPARPLRIAR